MYTVNNSSEVTIFGSLMIRTIYEEMLDLYVKQVQPQENKQKTHHNNIECVEEGQLNVQKHK